jgi:hypothetical protein
VVFVRGEWEWGGGEEREREDLREVVDARAWEMINESRFDFVDLDAFIKRVTLQKYDKIK